MFLEHCHSNVCVSYRFVLRLLSDPNADADEGLLRFMSTLLCVCDLRILTGYRRTSLYSRRSCEGYGGRIEESGDGCSQIRGDRRSSR